ncbi:MAG: flavin-nucleotide-binding protein [Alphaproteobacteria bacterium]|jgi:uncharacterized protein|nr:flavin-nucleotide-binding protein [Alphaproteobacteria bacterium]
MTTDTSPFHTGERAIQERFGLRDKIEKIGRKVIRSYMVEQHQAFFEQLPSIFLGWQDDQGWPWATVLTGAPGFLDASDGTVLRVNALPSKDDPLRKHLTAGAKIGGLGLQFETRRRNRLNGAVGTVDDTGFGITVEQSFGNCPQYIQTRDVVASAAPKEATTETFDIMDTSDIALIERSDTLFIATSAGRADGSAAEGADASHRGGKPGFVQVTEDGVLEFPDYAGNRQFSTLGNISLTGRAGLLFIDFENGDLLRLTGNAEIVWDGPDVDALPGAERIIRIRPTKGVRIIGGMPIQWRFGEYSPFLDRLSE